MNTLNTKKLRELDLFYRFNDNAFGKTDKGFNTSDIDEARDYVRIEFQILKGEMGRLTDILNHLQEEKLVINALKEDGYKILELRKSDDYFVVDRLNKLDDTKFLETKLNSGIDFDTSIKNLFSKLSEFDSIIEDKKTQIKKTSKSGKSESEVMKELTEINNTLLQLTQSVKNTINSLYPELSNYVETLRDFPFEEFENNFKGFWKK